jgi:hypothetical protein
MSPDWPPEPEPGPFVIGKASLGLLDGRRGLRTAFFRAVFFGAGFGAGFLARTAALGFAAFFFAGFFAGFLAFAAAFFFVVFVFFLAMEKVYHLNAYRMIKLGNM